VLSELSASLLLRERSIREEALRAMALELEIARERAHRVVDWLRTSFSGATRGIQIEVLPIAQDDSLSLAELEGYGRYGKAIRIPIDSLGDIGELWRVDREGSQPHLSEFAFYTSVGERSATFRFRSIGCDFGGSSVN
jgi:hypothetical protein